MSLHSVTITWFWVSQSLPFLLYATYGEAVNNNCIVFGLIRSTWASLETSTLTITSPKGLIMIWYKCFITNVVQIHDYNLIKKKLKLNVRCRNGRTDVGFNSTYTRYPYLHLIWASTIRSFGLWCDVLDSGIKHS